MGDLSAFQVDRAGGGEKKGVLYTTHVGLEGTEEVTNTSLRKGFYYKAPLHPPGSFKVAFPNAAEKMRKVIAQLKEGKRS